MFRNIVINIYYKTYNFLFDIESLNPHTNYKSFKNKIKEIKRVFDRQAAELDGFIEAKKIELLNKGLSPERIRQFHQFEADEFHVGDQCQVCLEEV